MVTARYDLHMGPPAVGGGSPEFPTGIPLAKPSVGDAEALGATMARIIESGNLTNGSHVRELERRTAEYLGVAHCIAVSSCTIGLMTVLRASDISGDVIVPSFTFSATAHAVAWAGLRPVFADVDPFHLTLSPESAERAIGVRTAAILATHIYGTPCNVEQLESIAETHGLRLFFDAAHAFGSRVRGIAVGGFGDAEVFSLSPTKVLVAGEGGIIATNDDLLAQRCRMVRNYGHQGDYDCHVVGLNARMSEFHAAIALKSLETLEERIERRTIAATQYRELLGRVPGVEFPEVNMHDRSTYKDFTILVDPDMFGLDAAGLAEALEVEGIETRRYYAPPVHAMRAYRSTAGSNGELEVTDWASASVLSLPLWSEITKEQVTGVAWAISKIQRYYAEADVVPPAPKMRVQ